MKIVTTAGVPTLLDNVVLEWLGQGTCRYVKEGKSPPHGYIRWIVAGAEPVPLDVAVLRHLNLWFPRCVVAHLNGCNLDNRRANLVVCTIGEWQKYRRSLQASMPLVSGWLEKCFDCQQLIKSGKRLDNSVAGVLDLR